MIPMGSGGTPELTLGRGRSVGQSTVREVNLWACLQASSTIPGDGYRGTPATVILADPADGGSVDAVLGPLAVQAPATIAIPIRTADSRSFAILLGRMFGVSVFGALTPRIRMVVALGSRTSSRITSGRPDGRSSLSEFRRRGRCSIPSAARCNSHAPLSAPRDWGQPTAA
jgi:hypothetical protein